MGLLTSGSVQQLLNVLDLTRRNSERGIHLPRAYQDAVRDVSNRSHVTYQTIGDFRRRLGYADVNAYLEAIRSWLRAESDALRRQLLSHSDSYSQGPIKLFFSGNRSVPPTSGSAAPGESVRRSQEPSPPRRPLDEVRIRMSPDLRNRIHLAHLANIGPTFEEAAVALLESGFETEKARIKAFLKDL